MNIRTRNLTVGMALLLIELFLILTLNLSTSRPVRANPGVLYAAPVAQGNGNCSSWDNACTLQTALTNAKSGDEIWVKAGVHYPGANRTDAFTLKNGVALYGGFAGTESSRNARDWQTNVTILSGDIDHNDLTDSKGVVTTTAHITGTNAYHVVTGSGTDSSAVLDGFFITAGYANGDWPNDSGGGMFNDGGSPTLTNVTFSGNSASERGGGMFNYNSCSPTLTNVTFSGNSAAYGGGMYNLGSSPTLSHVTFTANAATYDGGGMFSYYGRPKLTTVTFSGNTASEGGGMCNYRSFSTLTNVTFSGNSAAEGGGMCNASSGPTLINVTFNGNSASTYGGGMLNYYFSNPTLINVTFSSNSASTYGGGMYNFSYSDPTLKNVIMWADAAPTSPEIYNDNSTPTTPTITYSDIQGCGGSGAGWNNACGADGGGNIAADPRFVDAANGNLRLQINSPCIDAGDNTVVPAGVLIDLDGYPRFVNIADLPDTGRGTPPIVDMGAYEAQIRRFTFLPLTLRNRRP